MVRWFVVSIGFFKALRKGISTWKFVNHHLSFRVTVWRPKIPVAGGWKEMTKRVNAFLRYRYLQRHPQHQSWWYDEVSLECAGISLISDMAQSNQGFHQVFFDVWSFQNVKIRDCTKHRIPNKTKCTWVQYIGSHLVRSSNSWEMGLSVYEWSWHHPLSPTQFIHPGPAVARLVGESQLRQSMACSIKGLRVVFTCWVEWPQEISRCNRKENHLDINDILICWGGVLVCFSTLLSPGWTV